LENYLLSRDTDGKYILKRSAFEVFRFSVGESMMRSKTGIDESVDVTELPVLPTQISLDTPYKGR
jgi:hypothetical protein